MTSEELAIVLTARFDQVDKALTHVEGGVQNYAKKVEGSGKLISAALGLTELSIIGAVTVMGEFYRESLKAAEEQERLAMVLSMTAEAAGLSSAAVEDAKRKIQALTVSDNEAADTLAKLIRANVSLEDAVKLSAAAQDIAAGRGAKFEEVINAMTRAVETQNARMLRQYGITINNAKAFALYAGAHGKLVVSLSEEEKRQAVLNAVLVTATKYSGDHAKAMDLEWGKAQRLGVAWDELKDNIGGALLPFEKFATDVATRVTTKLNEMTKAGLGAKLMMLTPVGGVKSLAAVWKSIYDQLTGKPIEGPAVSPGSTEATQKKQEELVAKQRSSFAEIMRLTRMEHDYVLKGLDLEIAKIDEKRAKELRNAQDTVADERAKNQLIREINATADLEIQEAKDNFSKMDTQKKLAYLKNLERMYKEHGKNVVAIFAAIKEQQENASKEAAEKSQAVWQGFADYFASSFANSINIFEQQSHILEKAFESTINHMVQVLIQSAILSIIGGIFGIPGMGNLFGSGGFLGLGFDDPANDKRAYNAGQSKWSSDFTQNYSKGYVDKALMSAKDAPSPVSGSLVNENHFHYSPALSMGSPSEIRDAMTTLFTQAKRQGVM